MPGRPERGGRDLLGPIAGAGMLIGLLAASWAGLWRDPPTGTLALVAALAVAPALVRVTAPRAAAWAAVVTAVLACGGILAAAVHVSPVDVVRGDPGAWDALGAILPEGLGNAAATPLPLSIDGTAPLSALLILVLAGAAALIAWQAIVVRRPLPAVIAAAAGLAYRWTLVPPRHVVAMGVLALAVCLAAMWLCSPHRGRAAIPGRAALAGGLVLAIALIASAGANPAPAAWWDWREWTFGGGTAPTTLNLRQRYGPLDYPDTPIVIARVAAEEPVPLRAATLSGFDGTAFTQLAAKIGDRRVDGTLNLRADDRGALRTVVQEVTLGSARSPVLLAGGRPVAVDGLGRRSVALFTDESVRLDPPLTPGSSYRVTTLVPDPVPAALRGAGPYGDIAPELLTLEPGDGIPSVRVPVWGSGEPGPDPRAFGAYRGVYNLSREIIGDAPTAYDAVNRVETAVRALRYDENVERPINDPDLVTFLLDTKTGYCQHFAGAMALMLRMNGIPARVVVGFTSDPGRFDPDKATYEIIDRDAHSWVEVFFPDVGWVPFDPTPGRSVPNRASVSSPSFISNGAEVEITPGESETTAPDQAPRDPTQGEPAFNDPGDATGGDARWWLWLVPAVLGAAALVPVTLKAVRRRRRRTGDDRARVLGAARELESFLMDLGRAPDPAATPSERAGAAWRELGIDAQAIYGLASQARFSRGDPPRGAAAAAWSAVRAAKRSQGWRRRALASVRLRSLRR